MVLKMEKIKNFDLLPTKIDYLPFEVEDIHRDFKMLNSQYEKEGSRFSNYMKLKENSFVSCVIKD
jgi:hypothetical protein